MKHMPPSSNQKVTLTLLDSTKGIALYHLCFFPLKSFPIPSSQMEWGNTTSTNRYRTEMLLFYNIHTYISLQNKELSVQKCH